MNFKAGVIGSIVLTKYNNKTYKIDDVDDISNVNSTFTKKDGSKITYVQYYKEVCMNVIIYYLVLYVLT